MLDLAFEIFRRTLLGCLPYGVLSVLCTQLAKIYQLGRSALVRGSPAPAAVYSLCYVAGVLLIMLFLSAVLLRQRALASGESSSRAGELRMALQRFPGALVLVLLVVPLVMIGIFGLVVLLRATGVPTGNRPPNLTASIAFLAVFPSGVAVATGTLSAAFGLLLPNLLLRPVGPLRAISHNLRLLRGHFWRTAVIFMIATFVMLPFYAAALLVASLILLLLQVQDVALYSAILSVVLFAVGAVVLPYHCAVVVSTFGDLRVRREGIDLERRIARVEEF